MRIEQSVRRDKQTRLTHLRGVPGGHGAIESTYGAFVPSSKTTSKWVDCSPGRHDRRSMMIPFAASISDMAVFAVCLGTSNLPAPAFQERKQSPLCAHEVSQKFVEEISIPLFPIAIKLQFITISF